MSAYAVIERQKGAAQIDLFNGEQERATHQRRVLAKVQDEKDKLRAELKRLCEVPPMWIRGANVQDTRFWMEASVKSRKVLKSERASVQQLSGAVNHMRSLTTPPTGVK